jgi:5-amino-6-(5-phosphoribosylamino)uracil reductase
VSERPYVLVSCAMSVDGYIDDRAAGRLILSGAEDLDRVDEVRAGCDAIMVGASTVRRDDPRLVIRSAARRATRTARGLPESPVKVTVTATGDLPPAAAFFTEGSSVRLVYCARPGLELARARLSDRAEVIDAGDSPSPALILNDLSERHVGKVLLEGGGRLATSFLQAGLVDELHLVVAPFFVGDPGAPRFAGPGDYSHGPSHRMELAEVRQVGDVVLLRYLLDARAPTDAQRGVGARGAPVPWEVRVPQEARAPQEGQAAQETRAPQEGRAAQEARAAVRDAVAEHIRWLRQTIARLGADESPPGQRPGPADVPAGGSANVNAHNGGAASAGAAGNVGAAGTANAGGANADAGGAANGDAGGAASAGAGGAASAGAGGAGNAGTGGAGNAGVVADGAGGVESAGSANVDVHWLRHAVELSRRCPPSPTAFSVGAIIVAADGTPLATGFSRERDLRDHAEEVALAKIPPGDLRLARATIYSSLEPCGVRASRPCPCADLIIAAGIPRVVYAWHEPPVLAVGGGAEKLSAAGVSVIEIPELAPQAREINAHLIHPPSPT